jgi:hypothetical protein
VTDDLREIYFSWSGKMLRIPTVILTLAFCSTALADPVLYVCERPVWDGHEGCGQNNTYATYSILYDTRDINKKYSKYTFRGSKGSDAKKGRRYTYRYKANGEKMIFAFSANPTSTNTAQMSTITVDLDSMKGVMSGVKDSPEMTCRIEEI